MMREFWDLFGGHFAKHTFASLEVAFPHGTLLCDDPINLWLADHNNDSHITIEGLAAEEARISMDPVCRCSK